jgi:hypothetical protein
VHLVRGALIERGVDLFLDVHGDEATPYIFAAGCEGNPGYTPRIDALEDLFMDSLIAHDQGFPHVVLTPQRKRNHQARVILQTRLLSRNTSLRICKNGNKAYYPIIP